MPRWGLGDKFISPAAITRESRAPGKVELELVEGGLLVAYAAKAIKPIQTPPPAEFDATLKELGY